MIAPRTIARLIAASAIAVLIGVASIGTIAYLVDNNSAGNSLSASNVATENNRSLRDYAGAEIIHDESGTAWVLRDTTTDANGITAYTYTDNANVTFDDGGLGDAELILTDKPDDQN